MALSLSEGMFPPTVGLSDPIASLPFLMKEPTRWPATHGMINGFSSGGTFASVILKRL
jgi:3-oxoacyl-(acyl-carrier-protein) synthase